MESAGVTRLEITEACDGIVNATAKFASDRIDSKSDRWKFPIGKSHSVPSAGHYNSNYGNFETELYAEIRREAFGENIGHNSRLTSDEQDKFLAWLDLSESVDVGCGARGPTLRIPGTTGCSVIAIDVHEQAVRTLFPLQPQRGAMADEFLQALKAIWTSNPVEFHGRFYQIPKSYINRKPEQKPHRPIYLAAFAPAPMKRLATMADGWNPLAIPVDGMEQMFAAVKQMAKEAAVTRRPWSWWCAATWRLPTSRWATSA